MALIQPLIGSNLVTGAANFDSTLIGNSVWFDGSADDLDRSTTSHSSTEVVMACWFQLNKFSGNVGLMGLGTGSGGSANSGLWFSDGTVYFYKDGNGATTNQLLRDIGWYHILGSWKLDESTASNKGKLFINGEEVTSFAADPRSSWGTSFAGTATQSVGSIFTATFLKGYIAQAVMLDGQSVQGGDVAITDFVDTFTFGTNGSQIIPKKNSDIAALATTAGGNSFCLDFANSSDLGNDISSNNNDLTPNSMAAANQSENTPSKVYPVWNPLARVGSGSVTLSEGNTKAAVVDGGGIVMSQALPFAGLWYWEVDTANTTFPGLGIAQQSAIGFTGSAVWASTTANTHIYQPHAGNVNNDGTLTSYSGSAQSGAVRYAVAWDGDNRAIYFGSISGSTITWFNSGDPTSGSSKTGAMPTTGLPTSGSDPIYFLTVDLGSSSTQTLIMDDGDWTGSTNRPAAANALNSANLTAPDFQGIDYFNATLYTGNGTAIGSGGKAVTGTGFKPDWVWIKNRDAADSHAWYDAVRGTTKQIESDTTAAQSTESEGLTIFGSDGFTVGNLDQVNTSSEDYVAWQWLGSNSTSTNTNGSLNTTVTAASANHFSIVGWTMSDPAGAKTLGHGLSAAPEFIIVKNLTDAGTNWPVFSEAAGNTKYLYLSSTAAAATFNMWQNTSPTSTVFSISSNNEASGSANDEMIAYCFRSVPGVCKVGTYEGNNTADGPYISTGFKVATVITKPIDSTGSWMILDNKREPENPVQKRIFPNSNAAEDVDGNQMDFYSDGFKLRKSGGHNGSGTYFYLAMADISGNGTLPPIYGR